MLNPIPPPFLPAGQHLRKSVGDLVFGHQAEAIVCADMNFLQLQGLDSASIQVTWHALSELIYPSIPMSKLSFPFVHNRLQV